MRRTFAVHSWPHDLLVMAGPESRAVCAGTFVRLRPMPGSEGRINDQEGDHVEVPVNEGERWVSGLGTVGDASVGILGKRGNHLCTVRQVF